MSTNRFIDHLAAWDLLVATLKARQHDIPYLESHRTQLEAAVADLRALQSTRDELAMQLQQGTQTLRAIVAQAEDLASRLRSAVRGHYGRHSDKLREFGLKPAQRYRKPAGARRNPTAP
jgi:predicted  nucleic acid-binding Zn-ribbon protein